MQYKIRITDLAEKDLEDIGDYIAYELLNGDVAINTIKGIRKKINDLKYFPVGKDSEKEYRIYLYAGCSLELQYTVQNDMIFFKEVNHNGIVDFDITGYISNKLQLSCS